MVPSGRYSIEVIGSKGIVSGLVVGDELVVIRDEIGKVVVLEGVVDRIGDVKLLLRLGCVASSLGSNKRGLTS